MITFNSNYSERCNTNSKTRPVRIMIGMERATFSARNTNTGALVTDRDISQLDGLASSRNIYVFALIYDGEWFFSSSFCVRGCISDDDDDEKQCVPILFIRCSFLRWLSGISTTVLPLFLWKHTYTNTLRVLSSQVSSDLVRRCSAHLNRRTPDSSERCNTHQRLCSLWFNWSGSEYELHTRTTVCVRGSNCSLCCDWVLHYIDLFLFMLLVFFSLLKCLCARIS